jgi:hypothetical protein
LQPVACVGSGAFLRCLRGESSRGTRRSVRLPEQFHFSGRVRLAHGGSRPAAIVRCGPSCGRAARCTT